jgi:glycosyltransferase involved in cell wall biosynthesis
MNISLCVITKNEENNIKRCLECVSDILFEKVVVDTGSTDKTIEIAKKMGAKVYNFDWIDDFSAARNFAISKAKGDWIIFLDADEYIPQNQGPLLVNLVNKADTENRECIVSKLINYITDSDEKIMQSVATTIRIFRNGKKLMYEGAIHELLRPKQNRKLYALDASEIITVFHTGYSGEEVERKNKSDRNLTLLFKELEKKPNDSLTLFYISESLMINNKFVEAIEYLTKAKQFINSRNNRHPLLYKIYCNLLACMYKNNFKLENFKEVYNEAVAFDIKCPDFHYFMGKKLYLNSDFEKAINYYNEFIKKVGNYNYIFESHVLPRLNNIYDELLDLYIITKNVHKIVEVSVILLKTDKYNYKSVYTLVKTLKDFEESDAIYNFLFNIYSKNILKDKLYILRVAESLEFDELYELVFALLTEEEKNGFKQFKEQKENSFEEYQLEAQSLTEVECFQRGEYYNKKNNIAKSLFFHKIAFEKNPELALEILPENHPNYHYQYHVEEETDIKNCPLCTKEAKVHSVYNAITSIDFVNGFNPIRLWVHCEECDHIFANNIPIEIGKLLNESTTVYDRSPNLEFLYLNDDILNRIKQYTKGRKFLEIGIGSGEMLAAALEHGFNAKGLDIRKGLADNISNLLDVEVDCEDFVEMEIKERFDVLCLGDVLEHLTDPVKAIQKINDTLTNSGVVWISTPNFKSAFSRITKHRDPMWKVIEHINYFSYDSLSKLLQSNGFEILNYRISRRYKGSMEIIARKIKSI